MKIKRIIAAVVASAAIAFAAFGVTACNNAKVDDNANVPGWQEDGALKILCIGNSFSEDMSQWAYRIAKAMGVEEVRLGNLFIGGCSVDTHLNNAQNDLPAYKYWHNSTGTWDSTPDYKMSDAIKSENWDFITFQQASAKSGQPESLKNLGALMDYVRGLAGEETKFAWHMTWAYGKDNTSVEFLNYGGDQMTMYNAIINTVKEQIVPKEEIEYIIPSGTAIQNARTSFIGETVTRDTNSHLNLIHGRYMAGLAMVATLTGLPFDDLRYSPMQGPDAEKLLAACKESVKNAMEHPFEVTESQYKTR